ncbi:MAG: hypothetical protein II697_02775 [Clostridia bacterium]|nr:hypothetical protein [Clostridia bacterium]
MNRFVFVKKDDQIDQFLDQVSPEEIRQNVLPVFKSDCFSEDGYLIFEDWLCSQDITGPWLEDVRNKNLHDTGDPNVSYEDLCKYQKEYEAVHGKCDKMLTDAETMSYYFGLTQYCIDRVYGM